MSNENLSDLSVLLAKRELVGARRAGFEKRIGKLRDEIQRLRLLETELDNAIHCARIRVDEGTSLTVTSLTSRTLPRLKAWAALQRLLLSSGKPEGLASHIARSAIRSAIPSAPDATIRSYLHRFKKQGLLQRRGQFWQLTEQGRTGNHIESAE